MTLQRFFFTSAAALAVLGASACGGSSDSTDSTPASDPAPAAGQSVDSMPASDASATPAVGISQSRFDPTEITVGVGESVTFTNDDPFAHTVTSKDDSLQQFDSGNLGQDETFVVEFTEAGTFDYFCQIHPTMRATVVVSS